MREIADAADMGKSTLYDYFKSKDEILLWGVEDQIMAPSTSGVISGDRNERS